MLLKGSRKWLPFLFNSTFFLMSKIRHGDIIFCLIGSQKNPISKVQTGYNGAIINHCGIVIRENNKDFVLEAFPKQIKGVQKITLAHFKRRSHFETTEPRILIGRVSTEFQDYLDKAINYGLNQVGKPYDFLYSEDKNALYCSELILDMFNHAYGSYEIFPKSPLVFHDVSTGELLPHWQKHYADKGLEVPFDSMGSHPSSLSKSPNIDFHTISGDLF